MQLVSAPIVELTAPEIVYKTVRQVIVTWPPAGKGLKVYKRLINTLIRSQFIILTIRILVVCSRVCVEVVRIRIEPLVGVEGVWIRPIIAPVKGQ